MHSHPLEAQSGLGTNIVQALAKKPDDRISVLDAMPNKVLLLDDSSEVDPAKGATSAKAV